MAKSYTKRGKKANLLENATPDAQVGPLLDPLSLYLTNLVSKWDEDWKPQQDEHYENYQDREGLVRDSDTRGVGMMRTKKAKKLYLRQTRNKIRTGRAKIKDSHASYGRYPYDIKSSHPTVEPHRLVVRKIVDWQFDEMRFWDTLSDGINNLATYGTGVMVGLTQVERTKKMLLGVELGPKGPVAVEKTVKFNLPVVQNHPIVEFIPDPDSTGDRDGIGAFWRNKYQPEEVMGWDRKTHYDAQKIQDVLTIQSLGDEEIEGMDMLKQLRANRLYYEDSRIVCYNFSAMVPEQMYNKWKGIESEDAGKSIRLQKRVSIVGILAGGVVVKCAKNPNAHDHRGFWRCVWEKVENEFHGVGIARNNEGPQRLLNGAVRLLVESKSLTAMPAKIVQKGAFLDGEDFILTPDKTLYAKNNLTPDQVVAAIRQLKFEDVSQGLNEVINIAQIASDDDTAQSKYSSGNDGAHLNPTATGVSMIMGAAALPLKEVLQYIDVMWIEPIVEALIDWNLENLKPEVVDAVFGPEDAARWAEIQAAGVKTFMTWNATGATAYAQKEMLLQRINQLIQMLAAYPQLGAWFKPSRMAEIIWKALNTSEEGVVMTQEEFDAQMQEALAQQKAAEDAETERIMMEQQVTAGIEASKLQTRERMQDKKLAHSGTSQSKSLESKNLQVAADLKVKQQTAAAKARGDKLAKKGQE